MVRRRRSQQGSAHVQSLTAQSTKLLWRCAHPRPRCQHRAPLTNVMMQFLRARPLCKWFQTSSEASSFRSKQLHCRRVRNADSHQWVTHVKRLGWMLETGVGSVLEGDLADTDQLTSYLESEAALRGNRGSTLQALSSWPEDGVYQWSWDNFTVAHRFTGHTLELTV